MSEQSETTPPTSDEISQALERVLDRYGIRLGAQQATQGCICPTGAEVQCARASRLAK